VSDRPRSDLPDRPDAPGLPARRSDGGAPDGPARPDGGAPDGPARPDTDVAFTEPWQARIFATAVLTCERLDLPWDVFRDQLKATVAEQPDRPYFESFTVALERVIEAYPTTVAGQTA
jgi:hypothetical protein